MGNEHPTAEELQDFLDSRPKEFPLLQGWVEKLGPFSINRHAQRDASSVANILANLQPDDVSTFSKLLKFVGFDNFLHAIVDCCMSFICLCLDFLCELYVNMLNITSYYLLTYRYVGLRT